MSTTQKTVRRIDSRNNNQSSASNRPSTSLARKPQSNLATGFDNIFEDFRSSMSDLMAPFASFTLPGLTPLSELPTRYALVDLIDQGEQYEVHAELPGFNKDQVDVQINKDGLVISAKASAANEQTDKKGNYLHRERAYAAIERAITFPEEVVPQRVEATMKDGVLQIIVPKKEPKPEEKLTKIAIK
jgi:HSP20 family protein